MFLDTVEVMPPEEEIVQLMTELRVWCKGMRGRQRMLAEELGVREDVLANWLRLHRTPSLYNWLKLRDVARRIRRRQLRRRTPRHRGED